MQQFSKDQMKRARKTDLYDYLLRYHPERFKCDGQSIHPKDNESLSIKRGYSGYMDFATEDKGNSVDFLTKYMGYSLDDAVFSLCGETSADSAVQSLPPVVRNDAILDKKPSPIFPTPASNQYRQLFAYLTGRGIPAATIQGLVDQKILYQSKDKNNCVFINPERDWAELRGTYTFAAKPFHGVVANCRHDGFWYIRFGKKPECAYVCEAAIDAISLYILHRRAGKADPAYYISIGGVAKQPAIDRIKGQIRTVLAVDNDDAGQGCRDRNPELSFILPTGKDWNDDLQHGIHS